MGKSKPSNKCRYCRKTFSRRSRLECHFTRKPECNAARQREREAFEQSRRADRARSSSPLPNSPNASANNTQLMPVVEGEGLGEVVADAPMSPRRFSSVSLEDVQDEDMPNVPRWGLDDGAPASPRRFPSPTVEDAEDEDMLDVPVSNFS
ncbi:hypothetical protein FS749_008772 [Ceratobasidium sp. UAMH 11750]|nr:hypothetical protein FS749_008772 [Ceratobasidium sp. UAMH 11750]